LRYFSALSLRMESLRIGHGYDLHRLEALAPGGAGRPLVIGGVAMGHDRGPVAHSDGDALYHAVTDAILGALGLPDIGQLFADTDPRHETENSEVFLRAAVERAGSLGFVVSNVDCTVILERPKLSPVKEQMRANIARVLGVEASQVNVKGKTHEKVDAVGEGRAIEVHVVVLLAKR
jgi:2-C-methyl-D-erythritol 2,4-cyclodiphosphate synthase